MKKLFVIESPLALTARDYVALGLGMPTREDTERRYLLDRVGELQEAFLGRCSAQLVARVMKLGVDLYYLASEESNELTVIYQRIARWSAYGYRAAENFATVDESVADTLVDEYLEMCHMTCSESVWQQEYAAQELHEWLSDMRDECDQLCAVMMLAKIAPDKSTISELRGVLADSMYAT